MKRRRVEATVAFAFSVLAVVSAVHAGCGSCPGPPAEVAPTAAEEPEPAIEPPTEAEDVSEPTDAGPSDLPEEEDTAMASEGVE